MRNQDVAQALKTVSAVLVTPFDEALSVDLDALRRHVDFVLKGGVTVIVLGGNAGEFYSLTEDEWCEIVSAGCRGVADRAMVVAGIGHSAKTAIAQARFARECGCHAVMVHQPPHPFMSGKGYREYVRGVCESADIGVMPYVRSADIPDAIILGLSDCDRVVAVKYAIPDLQRFAELVAVAEKKSSITWICGLGDASAPAFFGAGASGFSSGIANFLPEVSLELARALGAGESERALGLTKKLRPIEQLRARSHSELNVGVVKEAMAQLGLGSRRVRPPSVELEESDRRLIDGMLREFFEAEAK